MSEYPFVEGEPQSYDFPLTSKQKEWKAKISNACPDTLQNPCLRFTVSSWQHRSNYFDLENISMLVLDVVGKEATTVWVSMALGESPGIAISNETPPPSPELCDEPIYIPDPPTRSVRSSSVLPELESRKMIGSDEFLGLVLTFDSNEVRVGDFSFEGPIKSLVDRFGPLLGTYSHGVADHRIHEIRVSRGHQPERKGVTVEFWFLAATEKE